MAKVILLGKSMTGVTTWASNRRQLMSNEAEATGTGSGLENALHQSYATFLNERSRPPSTGRNTRAWHSHVLTDIRLSHL